MFHIGLKLSTKIARADISNSLDKLVGSDSGDPSSQKIGSSNTSRGESIAVFHKTSRRLIDINLKKGDTHVSLHFNKSQELVHVTFRDKFKADIIEAIKKAEEQDKLEGEPGVKSISEVMWKEMKLDYKKLPDHYMRLAKIRLTGITYLCVISLTSFSLCNLLVCYKVLVWWPFMPIFLQVLL